jgi:hypothetical protein
MNAIKTGIHAKSLVLPSEKPADLEQLTEEYYRHHRPDSPEARHFVDELIHCEWTLRRLRAAETEAWQYQNHYAFSDRDPEKYPLGKSVTAHPNGFSKLQYRLDATRRAYLRALQALKELKAEPAPTPPVEPQPADLRPQSLPPSPQNTSLQIGFVPPPPVDTPPQPAPVGTSRPAPASQQPPPRLRYNWI